MNIQLMAQPHHIIVCSLCESLSFEIIVLLLIPVCLFADTFCLTVQSRFYLIDNALSVCSNAVFPVNKKNT